LFVYLHLFSDDFSYFEVTVFNTTIEDFRNKKSPTGGVVCYKHNNSIPKEKHIQITCNGYPVGNLVRLQLANANVQLVLCDFRIYEGNKC
jgi:hypothetical protein